MHFFFLKVKTVNHKKKRSDAADFTCSKRLLVMEATENYDSGIKNYDDDQKGIFSGKDIFRPKKGSKINREYSNVF